MEQRLSIITLGVKDLQISKQFYETLGWKSSEKSNDNIVFFQLGAVAMALYPWHLLAEDATVSTNGSGFRGIVLAHNVREKSAVQHVLAEVQAARRKNPEASSGCLLGRP